MTVDLEQQNNGILQYLSSWIPMDIIHELVVAALISHTGAIWLNKSFIILFMVIKCN